MSERVVITKKSVLAEFQSLEKDIATYRARVETYDRLVAFLRVSGREAWTLPRAAQEIDHGSE